MPHETGPIAIGGLYQSVGGGVVHVVTTACDHIKSTPVVVYQDAAGRRWVSPKKDFLQRFTRISEIPGEG